MGTPEFAVHSLATLLKEGYKIPGVVTAPDRPAGRGKKLNQSAVKIFAQEKNLRILQPEKLKDESFVSDLQSLEADLFIVVAFRMLPEIVWNMPPLGTFNLHASLLPQYRGAAPINWAVINGEKRTGVSTFFLEHQIDTGKVIMQKELLISKEDDAGTVHDKLMLMGSELISNTLKAIIDSNVKQTPQSELLTPGEQLKEAPKIFKDDCKIEWNQKSETIYNLIRGLSPYPAAWCTINCGEKEIPLKIFSSQFEISKHDLVPGELLSDGKSYLKVAGSDGLISINSLQLSGKKRLSVVDFLRGFQKFDNCKFG